MKYCFYGPASDLYVHRVGDKFAINVRGNRTRPGSENLQLLGKATRRMTYSEWTAWLDSHLDFEFHPLAGACGQADTLPELRDMCQALQEAGLQVPPVLFHKLDDELLGHLGA